MGKKTKTNEKNEPEFPKGKGKILNKYDPFTVKSKMDEEIREVSSL